MSVHEKYEQLGKIMLEYLLPFTSNELVEKAEYIQYHVANN